MSYVVCQLLGGFGNQLFQYAAARAVGEQSSRKVIFWHAAHHTPDRPYALDRLVPAEQLLSHPRNRRLRWYVDSKSARVPRFLAAISRLPCRVTWLIDKQRGYDPTINSIPGILVLLGFWQSEQYFLPLKDRIADSIRQGFGVQPAASEQAVCIHVRRGDYVGNSRLCLTPMDYFEQAISHVRSKLSAPKFTVFSDDPAWCREQFSRFPDVTIPDTTGRQEDQFDEFARMAGHSHFIISNSSFSWWAAYLGTHPAKIVVAPKQWFLPGAKASFDPGLESWVRI